MYTEMRDWNLEIKFPHGPDSVHLQTDGATVPSHACRGEASREHSCGGKQDCEEVDITQQKAKCWKANGQTRQF